jgi:hypothetical protein
MDLAVAVLGLLTACCILLIRRLVTNQDLLARCDADAKCLRQLARQARRSGDKPAAARHARVRHMVTLKRMGQEWRAVAVAVVPLAILGGWCLERLEYQPPRLGEPVTLILTAPLSAQGQLVHVAPQDGLASPDGWIRRLQPAADGSPSCQAQWRLSGRGRWTVEIRHGAATYSRPVHIDCGVTTPPVEHASGVRTELAARPYRPLGFIGPVVGLPAWLLWYLLVSLMSYPLLRRALRVH